MANLTDQAAAAAFSEWPTIRPEASQALPSNWHSIHKNDLTRAMVAQTEQAFLAIPRGNAPEGTDGEGIARPNKTSLGRGLACIFGSACDVTMGAAEAKAQYSAIVLGATGNVGGRIVQLLIKNPRAGRWW